jgi:hypothetical protein
MTKNEFLLNLQNGRRQWQQTWKGIDLFSTSRPRVPGTMSLRDTLYHIFWYEREMVELIQKRTLVGSAWWGLPLDERNNLIKTEGESVSLLQSWRLEQETYNELLAQVQTLRDEELVEARFFQEMPADWVPWEVIASNSYEHFAEHISDIF